MRHVDPYLPAEKLGLSDADRQILIDVACDLEAGAIHLWGMGFWSTCICGQMEKRGAEIVDSQIFRQPVYRLFFPMLPTTQPQSEITQQQAARACYNFLTTGEPDWNKACGK